MGEPGFPIPLRKGCALAFPGRGRGETRFPHTPAPAAYVHVRRGALRNLRAGEAGASGVGAGEPRPYPGPPPGRGRALPNLSTGWGHGETGFPHAPAQGLRPRLPGAGAWGNPVSPHPSSRAYVHVRRGAPREPPGGRRRGRRRRGGETPPLPRPASRQGLRPPRPSHRVGAWGNPVSPSPCARAAPSPSRGGAWGNPVSPCPCSSSLCSR